MIELREMVSHRGRVLIVVLLKFSGPWSSAVADLTSNQVTGPHFTTLTRPQVPRRHLTAPTWLPIVALMGLHWRHI